MACTNRDALGLVARADGDDVVLTSAHAGEARCRWSDDALTCPTPRPLWLVAPLRVDEVGPLLVLRDTARLAAGDPVGPALSRVTDALPPALLAGRSAVVALPATNAASDAVTGQPAGTGGVTLTAGGSTTVAVSPTVAPAVESFVLAHELVHALAGTATWSSPRWLAEGVAELVAAPLAPDVVAASDDAVKSALAEGVPTSLPTDADLMGAHAEGAYGLARVAVQVLLDRLGPDAGWETVAAWSRGEAGRIDVATLTAWWQEELRRR